MTSKWSPGCNCCGEYDCTLCEPTDLVITGILSGADCCSTDMRGTYSLSFGPPFNITCQSLGNLSPTCELEPSVTGEYSYGVGWQVNLVGPGEVEVRLLHRWRTSTETNSWIDLYTASLPIVDGCPTTGSYSISFDSQFVTSGSVKCTTNLGVALVYA